MDNLTIVNMHTSLKGLCNLSQPARGSYLATILEGTRPDICILPGDDHSLHENVVVNYGQYMAPNNNNTVLLYANNRVEMENPQVNISLMASNFPGLDLNKIVCPVVKVKALRPAESVIKTFNILTWRYDLFPEASVGPATLTENIVTFSQRLAKETKTAVLIAGDIPLDTDSVHAIVKSRNKEEQEVFLKEAQSDMREMGYLPSMTKASTRDYRHLFMLKVFKCKKATTTDCYIASKELEMSNASFVNLDDVSKRTGKQIKMEVLKQFCPSKTEMVIPQRPPKHHGG